MVLAARDLFQRDGFRPTTIAAVAERAAGVSAESVYKGFGTKAALAKAVFDLASPVTTSRCPSPNGRRCRRYAPSPTSGARSRCSSRDSPSGRRARRDVQILIRDGRHVDDALVPVWAEAQRRGADRDGGAGPPPARTPASSATDIDLDEVRDVLWNYLAIDHYERLVLRRGWSLERYTGWLNDAIISALCP